MKLTPLAKRVLLRKVLPVIALSSCLSTAWPATIDVDATANFLAALVLTKTSDIKFTNGGGANAITFDGTQTTADAVQLGTDGNITIVGTALNAGSGQVPGGVTIAGTSGVSVDITCSQNATLSNLSDHSDLLTMDVVQITMNTGTAYGSPGATCDGTGGTPLNYTLTATPANNKVLIGGELVATATLKGENYSTANGGGSSPVTLQVVYH
jgi:hypothetical protein